jgi:hypothetical protein
MREKGSLFLTFFDLAAGQVGRSQGTRMRNLSLTRVSPLVCGEVKNARERALVPDVFDLAAGRVGRSEAEIGLRSRYEGVKHVAYT